MQKRGLHMCTRVSDTFSVSESLQRREVIVDVSANLKQQISPHLRLPPPASQGREDGWVTPNKRAF